MDFLLEYFELRKEIDIIVENLFSEHKSHVKCTKGCSECCMNFSILPIEFYAIKKEIEILNFKIQQTSENSTSCIFLQNNECIIYNSRPIICRTHGLPLLYMSDDENFELSVCDLNFDNFDFEEFNIKNTFSQDTFNSKLFMLNKKFIEKSKIKFSEFELISINKLTINNEK